MSQPVHPSLVVAYRQMMACEITTREDARSFLRAAVAAQLALPRRRRWWRRRRLLTPVDIRQLLDAFDRWT